MPTVESPVEVGSGQVSPGLLRLISHLTDAYGRNALKIPDRSLSDRMGRPSLVLEVALDSLDQASRDAALLVTMIRREYDERYCVVVLPENDEETGYPLLSI